MAEAHSNKIQVCVRLRPLNAREKKRETTPVIQASSVQNTITVVRGEGKIALRHGRHSFHGNNAGCHMPLQYFNPPFTPFLRTNFYFGPIARIISLKVPVYLPRQASSSIACTALSRPKRKFSKKLFFQLLAM